MKFLQLFLFFSLTLGAASYSWCQENDKTWKVQARHIDPNNYYGVTVANGMIGLVSSPEPMKVKDVVLNGVYDYYQRGRVSNILKSFNHVNMELDVEGQKVGRNNISGFQQTLDIVTGKENIRQDLEYYEPRLAKDGPAMGAAILSVLYNRLGEPEKALELFMSSYKPNEVPPFGVIAETAGGTNPYFATGAGGMLQAILAGFGGLHITDQGIIQKEVPLPKSWRKLTIKGVGIEDETFINN